MCSHLAGICPSCPIAAASGSRLALLLFSRGLSVLQIFVARGVVLALFLRLKCFASLSSYPFDYPLRERLSHLSDSLRPPLRIKTLQALDITATVLINPVRLQACS